MSTGNFIALCAGVFAFLYVCVRIYDDIAPVQPTVEAEQDETRAVLQLVGQHHPAVRDADEYEDPMDHVLDFINRSASNK